MAKRKTKTYDVVELSTIDNIQNTISQQNFVSEKSLIGGNEMAVENKLLPEELYQFTIGKVLVTDILTGMEMYSATLKSSNVSKTASKSQIRAGEDNQLLTELFDDSEVTVEVTDVQSKRDWLAMKLGGVLKSEEITTKAFPKRYKVGTGKTITLDQVPVGDAPIVYDSKTGAKIEATNLAGTLTITTGAEVGDHVLVGSYSYTVTAEKIDIPSSDNGREVQVTISTPMADASRAVVCDKVYHFYKASLAPDFTDESSSEKSENAISTTFTVVKDRDEDSLGYLAFVPRKRA